MVLLYKMGIYGIKTIKQVQVVLDGQFIIMANELLMPIMNTG
jgi:hypothetical protein